jgi:hypothetical protein
MENHENDMMTAEMMWYVFSMQRVPVKGDKTDE